MFCTVVLFIYIQGCFIILPSDCIEAEMKVTCILSLLIKTGNQYWHDYYSVLITQNNTLNESVT